MLVEINQAIFAASVGAALSLGFDISNISVQNAKVAAVAAGVSGKAGFFKQTLKI